MPRSSHIITKQRDRTRLLFQSITFNFSAPKPGTRGQKDDEDLIDVLESVHGGLYGTHSPDWTRESLVPVAQRLPSSRSADVDGLITESDLRTLVTLYVVLALANGGIEIPSVSPQNVFILDIVLPLLAAFPTQKRSGVAGVTSKGFRKVLNISAVCFLSF